MYDLVFIRLGDYFLSWIQQILAKSQNLVFGRFQLVFYSCLLLAINAINKGKIKQNTIYVLAIYFGQE